MLDLFENYSINDIITFIIILALAIKGAISFFDWSLEKNDKVFHSKYKRKEDKRELEERLKKGSITMTQLEQNQEEIVKTINKLSDKVDLLIDSDKDDIKSFITREHHYFCYKQGWIDDYSLECCLRRADHYFKEGGNSFIKGFIEELKALPKDRPDVDKL